MSARLAMRATYHAIEADSDHVWPDVAAMWTRCLSTETRAKLALTALGACDDDHAQNIARHILGGAGVPDAAFQSYRKEAEDWVRFAAPDERDAYCLTIFQAMPAHRQANFLGYVQGRAAA